MSKKMLVLALATIAALLTGGWTAPQAGLPESADDVYLAVQRQAPGFGGMFLEGETLKVYLTDAAQRPVVERAIAAVFGSGSVPRGGVQVLKGQYDFARLKAWQNRAAPLLEIPGVVFTDADETTNRLAVGVEYAVAAAAARQTLEGLSVPAEAVQFIETGPIVQLAGPPQTATLRDRVRPLLGGIQINFPGYLCTYGFNATRDGVAGFVTNSHCTAKQGGVDNTQYWQPTQTADPAAIGVETVDPTYSRSKCPGTVKGKVCRHSDSAFVRLNTGVQATLGQIARTSAPDNNSLAISGAFSINAEGTAKVGDTVSKIGRTTGWTQGKVARTCADTSVSGSNVLQICQTFVSARVDSGDSGSPVFSGTSGVSLQGILWGGGAGVFVYSPIANIERIDELGPLTTR